MKYLQPLPQEEMFCSVSPSNVLLVRTLRIPFTGGHTSTERGYLPVLATKLREKLAAHEGNEKDFIPAAVHISQEDKHPLDFV
jgi:hypothetical protein